MEFLFNDRTNLDESLHRAAGSNRMQACHYCSILLWNLRHMTFVTVAESIISFFRKTCSVLLQNQYYFS